MKPARPAGVTWLAVGVFLLAVENAVRLGAGLSRFGLLRELDLSVPPAYLILSAGTWALAGLSLAAGLWRGAAWAGRWALPVATAYSVQFWLDRLALAASSLANLNWPFAAGVNALVLAGLWLVLSRPTASRFFSKDSEE